MIRGSIIGLILLSMSCNMKEPYDPVQEFMLQDGFEISMVSAEPLLDSPVAMSFDIDESIYVVELPGYMRDIEGSDEDKPDGKIVRLRDLDHDGFYEDRVVVARDLVAPRAVTNVYGGLLYTDGTSLYWDDISDDDPRELVDSMYVIGGNIEHQPNGLLYNIDNWIYSAKSNARYRKIGGQWKKEATSLRGQWGISHDAHGRLFYNDNSNPLYGDLVPPNILINNPYHKAQYGIGRQIATDRRIFLRQATAVNRGYIPGVLDSVSGKVQHFTSACGPLIHGGLMLGGDAQGDAFVCGPEGNLIKRYSMNYEGYHISAEPTYQGEEFLVSMEESFRPVNLYTGLDGALYILDLRKGVIQHRAYMTSYLRDKIEERRLDTLNGMGRIYKVFATGAAPAAPFPNDNMGYLTELSSPNHARRIMAQKALVASESRTLNEELAAHIDTSTSWSLIHGLWTMEGRGILTQDIVMTVAKRSKDSEVWYHLLQLVDDGDLKSLLEQLPENYDSILTPLLAHLNPKVEYHDEPVLAEAVISGLKMKDLFAYRTKIERGSILDSFTLTAMENFDQNAIQGPKLMTEFFKDPRTKGLALYNKVCSACHGQDGMGIANLAPPIMQSEHVNGDVDHLILLLLHGLKGPITVNGKNYKMNAVMPGIKDNPVLDDKAIAEIIIFVRNSFSFADSWIDPELRIAELREQTKDRTDMFTEKELFEWGSEKD